MESCGMGDLWDSVRRSEARSSLQKGFDCEQERPND